jgi:hypothetical protein
MGMTIFGALRTLTVLAEQACDAVLFAFTPHAATDAFWDGATQRCKDGADELADAEALRDVYEVDDENCLRCGVYYLYCPCPPSVRTRPSGTRPRIEPAPGWPASEAPLLGPTDEDWLRVQHIEDQMESALALLTNVRTLLHDSFLSVADAGSGSSALPVYPPVNDLNPETSDSSVAPVLFARADDAAETVPGREASANPGPGHPPRIDPWRGAEIDCDCNDCR